MGVLDELQEKLSGQSAQKDLARETREGVGAQMNTTEVIVPTELPDTGGVLDKLARKLERQEAVKFFMESDEAMNGPIKMPTRDASGNLVPPPLGDKFKERFLDPSRSTEAMAAKRAAEIRAKAQGPTIGPATPEQVNAPQVDFAPTEAQRAAKYDVESESYDAGKLNVLAQFLDRIQGRMQAGSAETFGALAKAGDFFQRVTGLPKGGLFDNMAAAGAYWADYFNTKAGPVSGKQRDLPEELKIVADTTGALAWDLPQIVALGPYGLAVHGGLYGLHRGGVQGMVEGTIAGALTHGIFKGIAGLPSLWQMPAAAGIGAGTAAMESDDPRQILANGATWAILQRQPGGRIVTAKEVGEGLPWVQEIKQGIKNVKGEQAVRRLNDPNQGVSREEFVLRFPEMKAHMNDRMAEGVLQSLNPDIDLAAIREAGGAMKVVEFSLSPLQHEFNLARDMVRQRIGLPSSKVADALLYFVKKMDSETLIQSHLGAKLAIRGGDRGPDYARDVDYWRESIMRGEIEARGLQPLTTGVEYVEAKYGKEGWDEITGMDATQRQAAENVRQMMLKRGYLTGRAAAEAEGDPNPERGPIPPSILKAAYEAEVAKLMGLNPMFTAPQWLNFFQTKDVPRGVTSTGPTQDTTNLLQFYLGQGKSRGYITAQGYQMVPAPPGHPAANDRGLIQWHRLVLETKLGRLLEPEEVAHHINHKPWDNRPENLVNMNRDAHLAHHMSAEGREIDQANYEAEMAKGPEKSYRLENFDTMEMRPSTEDEPVGPREFKTSVQKPRGGRTITQFEDAGADLQPWEVRQASKGRVPAGPESEPPIGATMPDGNVFLGLERFKVEKSGNVVMIGHVRDADGQTFTKEIARLTPEEAAELRSTKDWGQVIDKVIERVNLDRPAGGLPVKELAPGELAAREISKIQDKIQKLEDSLEATVGGKGWNKDQFKLTGQARADAEDEIARLQETLKTGTVKPKPKGGYMIEAVKAPFISRPVTEDAEPGDFEIMTKDGEIVKKGSRVTQRLLDETRWPAVEEPPAGTEPYDPDLYLHEDFTSREQLTVRDVFEGHKANGASTINPYEGDMAGTDMWAVSLYPERSFIKKGKNLTKEEIYNFWRKNSDLLSSDPRLNIGTWYNEKDGKTYMDVTVLLPKKDAALAEQLGRRYNQKAITLLDSEFNFPSIETGGTGKVLKKAGWAPEGERLNDLYATGEMKTTYHFGNAPDVSPHGMGTAQVGEEGRQFERGYRGTNMLKHGYYLKSNFYTPESSTVESHLWGGRPVGRGEVDMGQLFNAKDLNPESDLSLDQQAVRAGKRGWYEPTTGQVRLFTPAQVERLGIFRGPGKKAVKGSELEKYVKFDNPSLTSEPGDPEENYDDSPVFGKKGGTRPPSGSFGLVAPGTGETAEVVDRLRFLLFDKFHPIHQLVKMLEDSGIDVPLMQNPSTMVKLLAGTTGRADAKVFYKRFVTDANGRIVFNGKSLKDIYAPHKGDMAGFDDWLWARAEREEHRLNATRLPDEQVKLELTQQEAERIYQAGKAKYDASGKELTSYFHSLLDELADSGLMTKQDVAGLKALRPDYSPLRKGLDEIATKLDAASGTNSARQTLDRVKSPIKTRRGTEKDFSRIPPTQAAVLMTYEITSAVERNRAARAIVDLRSLSPEMAKLIHPTRPKITYVRDIETGKDVMTIGRQEADTIAVSIDGKRHFFKVPDDVAQSMKMIYETGLGRWVKLMAIPARTLRTGATSAPEFAFRNPLRDWLTAFMNAKKGFNPLTDFSRGLFQLVFHEKGPDVIYKKAKMDQEAYWKWKASGGEWSMLVSLDKALGEQAVRQMHRETDTGLKAMRKYIKTPLGYLEALSEAGEKPTRLGVFERARRKGLSDVEAAVESREASTDFAVRGAETKSLSAMYTFLNARAQTTIKLGKTAIENPGKFAIKGLAAAGIPSLVLYYINRQDPDYWKRDQMERDLFWFLPIDIKGRQVKIPKGEIGLIFGTTVEKVLQFLDHEGALPEVVKGGTPPPLNPKVTAFLEEIMQNMSPIGNAGELLPTFARPIAEWVNNKSYYYGTPLESEADQGVAPYLRYKPGTSELMKTIGKGLGIFNKGEGVSPIKLENTLRGHTGGVGRHTLRVADTLADVAGITDKGARPSDPMNTPGMAGFVSRRAVGFESEPAKVFYEMAGRIDMTKRTLGELLKDKSRAKEVLTWIEQHPQEMSLLKVSRTRDQETGQVSDLFNDAKRRLADLRKQANMISEDKNLTGDQKRQALDFLDKKVSEVVDPLWRLINAASQTPSKK